jgi:hypothetical protein
MACHPKGKNTDLRRSKSKIIFYAGEEIWETEEGYLVRNCIICIVECQILCWINRGQWTGCGRCWEMAYTKSCCLQNVRIEESVADFVVLGSMLMMCILEE